jgi:peptidoglycan/LPS O-acetylase OafA/YrhL
MTSLIYLVFVAAFPLIPYIQHEGRMLDIEIILRDGARWLIWVYIIGLVTLFYAFWRMVQILHRFSQQTINESNSLRLWILGIGGVERDHFIVAIPHHCH